MVNLLKNKKSYLKSKALVDISKNPSNWGVCKDCDFLSTNYNPSCGDSVVMCGFVQGDKIQEVRFEGTGCIISVAMASKLTEFVKDMQLQDALKLDESIVAEILGMELGINRLQCATLSLFALQKGLQEYQVKS